MANRQSESVTFEEIRDVVLRHTDHPFLRKNHVQQTVSRFHFDVIQAILRSAGVSPKDGRQILTAVLLLHQGLSIHDDVDTEVGVRRQLTVLAGDYNSSLYYSVLARLGNRPLLIALCNGVVAVNEAKMSLFNGADTLAPERYWKLHETVQGALVMAVASQYLEASDAWSSPLRSLIRAHVINEQVTSHRMPNHVSITQALSWLTESVDRLLRVPSNHILEPILTFVIEYIQPLQNSVERLAWAEGIR